MARYAAVADPAGPAPTMMTSAVSVDGPDGDPMVAGSVDDAPRRVLAVLSELPELSVMALMML